MAFVIQVLKKSLITFFSCWILLFLVSASVPLAPAIFKLSIKYLITRATEIFTSTAVSAVAALPSFAYLYCTILPGPFFCTKVNEQPRPIPATNITHSVSSGVKIATDIFDSIIGLGDPNNLPLHQSEILELALAIKHSSSLEGKEFLGAQMWKLSDLTRDVKDHVIGLNSQGANAFFFISYQFSRLQNMIEKARTERFKYTTEIISRSLDLLFDNITDEFSQLLVQIEGSLPIANRAVDLGIRLSGLLLEERSKLIKTQEETPLWRKLFHQGSWSAKQLSRDLVLTSESIEGLKTINKKLEDLKSVLIGYQKNVGFFKASLSSIHLADNTFSVEEKVYAMRPVIGGLDQAVKHSKIQGDNTAIIQV